MADYIAELVGIVEDQYFAGYGTQGDVESKRWTNDRSITNEDIVQRVYRNVVKEKRHDQKNG